MSKIISLFILSLMVLGVAGVQTGVSLQAQDDRSLYCPEGVEANLVIAAGTVANELQILNEQLKQYNEFCPNIQVNALESPELATERLQLYLQFLAGQSPAVDIYQIDVIWPRIVAEHMVDLYEYAPADSEIITQHSERVIENNTVDGKLVGMPWFTDAGLFFYRTDLLEKYGLEVPQTWDELEEAALIIQEGERADGNPDFWGYVWQGASGEATTVNALEWQASNGGGIIIDSEGNVQVNNPETIEAIERAADWIGWISPTSVTGHRPTDSLAIWTAGNAAFMRNWPFAYASSLGPESTVADKFDAGALPAGESGQSASVLGGWQLAVSKYSNNVDAAAAVVLFLTSKEQQRYRAVNEIFVYNPTISSLYEDEEVLESSPLFGRLFGAFLNAVPRPSTVTGDRYQDVSDMYSAAVHSVLRGQSDARTAMEDLEFDLEDLIAEIGD